MAEPTAGPASHRRHPARRKRRAVLGAVLGVLLLGAWAGVGMAGDTNGGQETPGGTSVAPPRATDALPFDLPPAAELRDSAHLVFAHYFTPYPLSLDNQPAQSDYYSRNYLTVRGENGKHAAYGGLLRDRPLPVAEQQGDWQLANLEQEVRTARDAGIDGFSVDILSLSGPNWDRVNLLLKAAHEVDPAFRIMLMPDMTSLHTDPATLAEALAKLAAQPAAHRLGDGRLVVSPFKAEAVDPAWWSQMMARLDGQHGIRTALVPLFLNFGANAERYAPISYGFSEWGNRSYTAQEGASAHTALAHRLGKVWMQPVSVQDARPNQGVYDEAGNTANLRTTWGHAIDDGADWVQLTTWNDYSEGSQFAPSLHNGYAYLDISSYYLTRFKTGKWPQLVRDRLYVTSRVQFAAAVPSAGAGQRLMRPRAGTAQPRDEVEVLSFLPAPATVDTAVGTDHKSFDLPTGVTATLLPLRTGHSSAAVVRDGRKSTEVTTRYPVGPPAQSQDLQYYAVTSGDLAAARLPGTD